MQVNLIIKTRSDDVFEQKNKREGNKNASDIQNENGSRSKILSE
ncbi:hypothetical protein [Liquorilactobacillus aquaticus]|nr:hypothetical protein [Liquorilactobacillus aquaticus]